MLVNTVIISSVGKVGEKWKLIPLVDEEVLVLSGS